MSLFSMLDAFLMPFYFHSSPPHISEAPSSFAPSRVRSREAVDDGRKHSLSSGVHQEYRTVFLLTLSVSNPNSSMSTSIECSAKVIAENLSS